ncbi:hypothetical protein MPH_13126 [Macrophomina phaseolina MS6]|uniref:Uncharacterized protein n=1 Tax=Macrophomina phaseolina (strain MS6) TaxID=1126212 RepID=K2R6H3_MACPH|nr:hypothetical protein MPH_13126 [Macrophomina phaseolina MS6]
MPRQNILISANTKAEKTKRAPANAFRSAHGKRQCDVNPDGITALASRPKRIKEDEDAEGLVLLDAGDIIRHLMERASPRQLRARLGKSHISEIFKDVKEDEFGRIAGQSRGGGKFIRKMFSRMARDTRDGRDTGANAEYLLQILEEASQYEANTIPAVVEEMFKLLVILVSYRKPPPSNYSSSKYVMTKKQVLHIVIRELREAVREVEQRY